ncbi:hypothetical protein D3C79_683980 [compost metagenome]
MPATALEHHRHLAFVVERVGNPRAHQWLVVGGQAAGETWEQGRVVRLRVRRLLGVVGIVQAHANDLARLAQQRQVVLLTDLHHRALDGFAIGGQVDAPRQQRLQGFLAQHLDAFRGTHAQHGAALMIERQITHGS